MKKNTKRSRFFGMIHICTSSQSVVRAFLDPHRNGRKYIAKKYMVLPAMLLPTAATSFLVPRTLGKQAMKIAEEVAKTESKARETHASQIILFVIDIESKQTDAEHVWPATGHHLLSVKSPLGLVSTREVYKDPRSLLYYQAIAISLDTLDKPAYFLRQATLLQDPKNLNNLFEAYRKQI